MNKLALKLDTPELQGIQKSKAEQIRTTFEPMAEMLSKFEDAFNEVISESEKGITLDVCSKAKRLRIDIGKVRIETEKVRKEQKEEYLRAGKAIDGVSNILKWAVSDKENKLKEIESYFEIQEQQRIEKLQSERVDLLSTYVEDAHERSLGTMEDDVWEAYFDRKKQEHTDRIEAEKQAELKRIEEEKLNKLEQQRRIEIAPYVQFISDNNDLRTMPEGDYQTLLTTCVNAKSEYDKEQERIRKENERMKSEAEAKAKLRQEREDKLQPYMEFVTKFNELLDMSSADFNKSFTALKSHAKKVRKERDEAEKVRKLELEKQAKLQAELDAKKQAEAKAEADRIQAEAKAKAEADKLAKSPAKKQLTEWINSFELPETTVQHKLKNEIINKFESFKKWAKTEVNHDI